MFNYYSYLKTNDKKEKQNEKNLIIKPKPKAFLIKGHEEKLVKEIKQLALNPIYIYKYKDPPPTNFFTNFYSNDYKSFQTRSNSTTVITNKLKQNNSRLLKNSLNNNSPLNNQKIKLSFQSTITSFDFNSISEFQKLKFIKKPITDLEKLYNSLLKFYKEESSLRIVKSYSFPLGNKLRNYKNNSAFEEYYRTPKRIKLEMINLLKGLTSTDIYKRETRENHHFMECVEIIIRFLEDNKLRYSINKMNLKTTQNESSDEENDIQFETNELYKQIKFVRSKYANTESKIKPYIENNEYIYDEKPSMSNYLSNNANVLKNINNYTLKKRAESSINLINKGKALENDNLKKTKVEHQKMHFKSIQSYQYKLLEKQKEKISEVKDEQLNKTEKSINNISERRKEEKNFLKENEYNLVNKYINSLDKELKDEIYKCGCLNETMNNMNKSFEEIEDGKRKSNMKGDFLKLNKYLKDLKNEEWKIKTNPRQRTNEMTLTGNIKKKLFEEDNEYLILNKKVYKKNELYKAIPILLKMCIKKY